MNSKRFIFIAIITFIFLTCLSVMDEKYDPLARYQYVTEDNREILLECLDTSDKVEFVIQKKLKPEDFISYYGIEDFNLFNVIYYNNALDTRETTKDNVIKFVNKYVSYFTISNISTYLENYTYEELSKSFEYMILNEIDNTLLSNPNKLTVNVNDSFLGYFKPHDLTNISEIPTISKTNHISVRSELKETLRRLCEDIEEVNNELYGNLILVQGYTTFEEQVEIYNAALLKYGAEDVLKYVSLPGYSDYQLGTLVRFEIAELDTSEEIDYSTLEQVIWLEENAHKYGFIVRYPKDKEAETNKNYQPLTLRYVGVEIATNMYEEKITIEER